MKVRKAKKISARSLFTVPTIRRHSEKKKRRRNVIASSLPLPPSFLLWFSVSLTTMTTSLFLSPPPPPRKGGGGGGGRGGGRGGGKWSEEPAQAYPHNLIYSSFLQSRWGCVSLWARGGGREGVSDHHRHRCNRAKAIAPPLPPSLSPVATANAIGGGRGNKVFFSHACTLS